MERIKKYLEQSKSRGYYEREITRLSDAKKEELIGLIERLEQAGAKDPMSWAMSEVTEGIPQFGRFLVMKSLYDMIGSVQDQIDMAADFDDDMDEKYSEICDLVGEDKIKDFLKSYSKGMVYNFMSIIDEGNINYKRDKIGWVLMKTDENDEMTGQIIQGLHEDFLEFEDEIL